MQWIVLRSPHIWLNLAWNDKNGDASTVGSAHVNWDFKKTHQHSCQGTTVVKLVKCSSIRVA
eukprot:2218438-Ditylum_brightwellii.AAC.1